MGFDFLISRNHFFENQKNLDVNILQQISCAILSNHQPTCSSRKPSSQNFYLTRVRGPLMKRRLSLTRRDAEGIQVLSYFRGSRCPSMTGGRRMQAGPSCFPGWLIKPAPSLGTNMALFGCSSVRGSTCCVWVKTEDLNIFAPTHPGIT